MRRKTLTHTSDAIAWRELGGCDAGFVNNTGRAITKRGGGIQAPHGFAPRFE